MHVMCHMRRRIHACHVSYEEEDRAGWKDSTYVYMYIINIHTEAYERFHLHIYTYIINIHTEAYKRH